MYMIGEVGEGSAGGQNETLSSNVVQVDAPKKKRKKKRRRSGWGSSCDDTRGKHADYETHLLGGCSGVRFHRKLSPKLSPHTQKAGVPPRSVLTNTALND